MSTFAKLSALIRNKPREPVTNTLAVHLGDTLPILPPGERAAAPPEPPPNPGDRLGEYLLQDLLGSGASCHVFRAWHETNQCPVAIKIVNWGNVVDRNAALRQLRMEAAALARIKHARVLRFIDFGFDARWPYLVTEFVDGRPLGELIRCGGGLPIEWTLHLMSQVVDGLGAVWKAGIVHRDLKPDNILVSSAGVAKIIDFGVAKSEILKSHESESGPELAGTAAYLSPEQARDAALADRRSDIYSLGVTLFETLTGRLPFEASNRMQMIFQHLKSPPPPATKFDPTIPPLASDLCLWMLSKNPDERPQHYEDLREGMNTVIASLQSR